MRHHSSDPGVGLHSAQVFRAPCGRRNSTSIQKPYQVSLPAPAAEDEPLVDELCRLSPEFKTMWRNDDDRSYGEAVKHIRHPVLGPLAFEYSAFAVDGRPDLSMVVYNLATPADADKIRSLIRSGL
jgi:MmyB-like transcription regulator ligand binding domain